MWIVAKIKSKESSVFKQQLREKLKNEVKFYEPKVFYKIKNIKKIKNILGSYIFCFNEKFKDYSHLNSTRYTKGLNYFLKDYKNSQNDILKFITFCKNYEDKNGFLVKDFFKKIIHKRGKFLNGPLANLVFEILENNKNNLVINVRQKKIQIRKNSRIFYLPT
tara:strand:+ start:4981 stop:5469 length:489 start_codon:yes stop_codon:yes gene_type:complete